jgi:2,3-dihydroxybenzoate-AMP ligase
VLRPGTEAEVAEGETGKLAARGPYAICGYPAAPDRDREAFTAEGFYRSGDLVRARRYEGSLSYSSEGRVNDLMTAAVRRSTLRRSSSWSQGTAPLPRWP